MFDPLKINRPIDITTGGSRSNTYRCKVKAFSGERMVALLPAEATNPADLIPGTKVKITYVDNTAVYSFYSEIIIVGNGTPITVTLGKPVNLSRIQRRNFVRLDIKLKVISNKIDEDTPDNDSFTATTIDISGGGILFGCNTELTVGQTLEAKVFLSDNQTVTANGRVVRVIENSASSKQRFSVGFEFISIKESERDKIIKFIFNQQRVLRNKGLL